MKPIKQATYQAGQRLSKPLAMHSPNKITAAEIRDTQVPVKLTIELTEDSVIKSFQNGISKGFLQGLDVSLAWFEANPKNTLTKFRSFIKESKEAWLGKNKN